MFYENRKIRWQGNTEAALTLSFDDCYEKTLRSVLPLLNKYKIEASFNVITGLIGKEFEGLKLASFSELEEAARQGMEIASHSLTHADLIRGGKIRKFLRILPQKHNKIRFIIEALKTIVNQKKNSSNKISKPLWEREVVESKVILNRRGIDVVSFVYPGGSYNRKLKDLVRSYYLSARSSDAGLNRFPLKDFYNLKVFAWDKWTTVDTVNKWVDKAIREKVWLIETFHLVADKNKTNYKYFTSVVDFEDHLKYIKSKNIWVATQREVINSIKNINIIL